MQDNKSAAFDNEIPEVNDLNDEKSGMKNALLVAGTLSTLFTLNLGFSGVNLSLVAIADAFGVPLGLTQWMITIFLIPMVATVIIGGRLGDIYGHKKIAIAGGIVFILGLVASGLAQEYWQLLSGRLLQGLGAGVSYSPLIILEYQAYSKDKKGTAAGVLNGVIGLSIVSGLFFGGMLIHYFSWRWLFLAGTPFLVVSLLMILFSKTEKKTETKPREKVDYLGTALLSVLIVALVISIEQPSFLKYSFIRLIILPLITIIMSVWFYLFEKKTASPAVDFSIFREYPKVFLGCVGRFAAFICFYILLYILSIYLQKEHGFSPFKAGIYLLPMTLLFGLLTPFGGILLDKFNLKHPLILSFIGLFLSNFLLIWFAASGSWILFFASIIIFSIAFSINAPGLLCFVLKGVPEEKGGIVSGFFYLSSMIAGVTGLTFSEVIIKFYSFYSSLTASQKLIKILSALSVSCAIVSLAAGILFFIYFNRKILLPRVLVKADTNPKC
ncbi:MAG: MFS transporter [Lentisphaerae bacterium]|nr:MFS transporter [Lentisphaerota bacterium]MCP4102749.1 MFS transporter [Lentisphaerota bacterium]